MLQAAAGNAGGSNNYWFAYWDDGALGVNSRDFYQISTSCMTSAIDLGYKVSITSTMREENPRIYMNSFTVLDPDLGGIEARKKWTPTAENFTTGSLSDGTNLWDFSSSGLTSGKSATLKFTQSSNALVSAYENNHSNFVNGQRSVMHYDTGKVISVGADGNGYSYQVEDLSDTTLIDISRSRLLPSPWRQNRVGAYAPRNDTGNYYVAVNVEYGSPNHIYLIKMPINSDTPVWERQIQGASEANARSAAPAVLSDGTLYLIEAYNDSSNTKVYWSELDPTDGSPTTGTYAKTQITRNGTWNSSSLKQNQNQMGLGVLTDSSDNTYVSMMIEDGSETVPGENMSVWVGKFNSSMSLQWALQIQSVNADGSGYSNVAFLQANYSGTNMDLSETYKALFIPLGFTFYTSGVEKQAQGVLKIPTDDPTSLAGTYDNFIRITDITSEMGTASVTEGGDDSGTGSFDAGNRFRTSKSANNLTTETAWPIETHVDF
jgi:hypothetical protein